MGEFRHTVERPWRDGESLGLEPGEQRTTEHYRPEAVADVAAIYAKSAGFGMAAALLSVLPAVALEKVPLWAPLAVLPVAWSLAFVACALWPREIITVVEQATRMHVTRETLPEPPRRSLVTVKLEDGRTTRFINDIPDSPELRRFLRAHLAGVGRATFSERGAGEYQVSAEDFRRLRDQLIERGLLAWKNTNNPRSGYREMRGFKRALEALAGAPPLRE